jgi:hypothetical protein
LAKLLLVLVFFVAWTSWVFATGGWGMSFLVWAPLLGVLITAQLIVFRFFANVGKDA